MDSTLDSVNIDNATTRPGYKVCILNASGKLSKVIAFGGDNHPLTADSDLFSPIERRFIEQDRPELIATAAQIHPDDTTGSIKKKIANALGGNSISYDELYLFIKRKETLDLKRLYRAITLNETRPLTKAIMGQLLANMEISTKVSGRISTSLRVPHSPIKISPSGLDHSLSRWRSIFRSDNSYRLPATSFIPPIRIESWLPPRPRFSLRRAIGC
jgi:hypothetical protein